MHIILHDCETGLFYGGPDKWVPVEEAESFESSMRAIEVGLGLSKRLEVLFWFDDPRYNIAIPIRGVHPLGKETLAGKSRLHPKA